MAAEGSARGFSIDMDAAWDLTAGAAKAVVKAVAAVVVCGLCFVFLWMLLGAIIGPATGGSVGAGFVLLSMLGVFRRR
jgi:hypothetical protein